jgi:hypothetical protein
MPVPTYRPAKPKWRRCRRTAWCWGAALATAKPQACPVAPGPGLFHTGGALPTAYGTNAPVPALTGQIPALAIGNALGDLPEIRDHAGRARRHRNAPSTSGEGAVRSPLRHRRRAAKQCTRQKIRQNVCHHRTGLG